MRNPFPDEPKRAASSQLEGVGNRRHWNVTKSGWPSKSSFEKGVQQRIMAVAGTNVKWINHAHGIQLLISTAGKPARFTVYLF